jgi:polyphosphate kinase
VRSVVGRFLEHHRAFHFHNGGDDEVWLSSADWMERNLYRRVEVAFPLLDKKIRERVIEQLQNYADDHAQSWILQADGRYVRDEAKPDAKGVQTRMLEEIAVAPPADPELALKAIKARHRKKGGKR